MKPNFSGSDPGNSKKIGPAPRVAVVLHAHYKAELDLVLRRWAWLGKHLSEPPALIVFRTFEGSGSTERSEKFVDVSEVTSSLGRNFGTLLRASALGHLEYDVIFHLHTKRSASAPLGVGRLWFLFLCQRLLRPSLFGKDILEQFSTQSLMYFPKLGGVFRTRSKKIWSPTTHFRNPESLDPPPAIGQRVKFPIGGMFMISGALLRKFASCVEEAGPIFRDHNQAHGETEHFLERYIGFFASKKGHIV